MSAAGSAEPIIAVERLVKASVAPPLRVGRLVVSATDRFVLAGLDRGATEMLVHLLTGAAVPDEGTVRIEGRDTRNIATDAEWLHALDRFGLVSERSLLLDGLTVEANLALPLTISIDPVPEPVRARVRAMAADVGIDQARLAAAAAALSADERMRVHLARALAPGPRLLLIEHPTHAFGTAAMARAFGDLLRRVADRAGVGWLALSNDPEFASASGSRRLTIDPATGEVRVGRPSWFGRLLGS